MGFDAERVGRAEHLGCFGNTCVYYLPDETQKDVREVQNLVTQPTQEPPGRGRALRLQACGHGSSA
jgi:hypothetical protein